MFSMNVFTNTGRDMVTVDEVTVNGVQNLTVLGTDIVPLDVTGLGGAKSYPPDHEALSHGGLLWDDRSPAAGATIDPDTRASAAIGVQLADFTAIGSFRNLTVSYHVGGKRYRLETSIEFVVPPIGTQCSSLPD